MVAAVAPPKMQRFELETELTESRERIVALERQLADRDHLMEKQRVVVTRAHDAMVHLALAVSALIGAAQEITPLLLPEESPKGKPRLNS